MNCECSGVRDVCFKLLLKKRSTLQGTSESHSIYFPFQHSSPGLLWSVKKTHFLWPDQAFHALYVFGHLKCVFNAFSLTKRSQRCMLRVSFFHSKSWTGSSWSTNRIVFHGSTIINGCQRIVKVKQVDSLLVIMVTEHVLQMGMMMVWRKSDTDN